MTHLGKLYLLPIPISENENSNYLPEYNFEIVRRITKFIAEDAKIARRFLKHCSYLKIEDAEILLLNEHTKSNELGDLLFYLKEGLNVGLMSDAGCPAIADPGADFIKLAHQRGIEVIPLVGPSSIVLSIMASGFNGQNFAFVGYLPIENVLKTKRIKEIEQLVYNQNQAQFFIETPYRNDQLFDWLLTTLLPDTLLFIGRDVTSSNQLMVSKKVKDWKKSLKPVINKIPVVYGIYK